MFKNRLVLILAALSMLLVTLAVSQPFSKPPKTGDLSQPSRSLFVPYIMDSATRSYIAWGEALEKAKLNALDSGTRSYIAWGKALEAAGKLGDSGTCSKTMQENIFVGIPSNLDSATRSYIAWAQAVEAESYAVDSATQSYMAQAKAIEAERYAIDSATRSYIAWGKAEEAQRLAC